MEFWWGKRQTAAKLPAGHRKAHSRIIPGDGSLYNKSGATSLILPERSLLDAETDFILYN
jgi:hypothetical protein